MTLTRLNKLLLCCLLALYALAGVLFYERADADYKSSLLLSAKQQMETAQALRKFTVDFLRAPLLRDAQEFHSAAVPSFVANKTMGYLASVFPGFHYREVAINPTNPANLAKGWEVSAIETFRKDGRDVLFEITGPSGNAMLHYARPIRVSSSACLACHGLVDHAPQTMRAKYGDQHGFGWQQGEVVGAQVVSVAADKAMEKRNKALVQFFVASGIIALLSFAVISLVVQRGVIRPMETDGDNWRRLASEDPLTGAANRRSFIAAMEAQVARSSQVGPLSIVFIDVDHFKSINDGPGHQAGDEVLKELVRRVKSTIRKADFVGRYGGEEFAVLVEDTDERGAMILAEKLRSAIADADFRVDRPGKGRLDLQVTASFGVAELRKGEGCDQFMARADKALYAAKRRGRNQSVPASDLADSMLAETE